MNHVTQTTDQGEIKPAACEFASASQTLTSTATDSEAVTSWGALVAALTNDVGFAKTLTPHWVTLTAEGALRVTVTGWQHRRDTVSFSRLRSCCRARPGHLRRAPSWMMEEMLQTSVEHTSARAGVGAIRKESRHM